jgi:membrane-associated phospholipid phosphatase
MILDSTHFAIQLSRKDERQTAIPVTVDTTIPKAWDGRVAYVISQIGSPPVLAIGAMILTASTLSSPRAWIWTGIYVFLAIVTPLLYLIWLVRRGLLTDLDAQLREQRMRPMVVTVACTGLAWLVLALGAAPLQMVVLAGALWLQAVLIFCITLCWKISVHCATASATATLTWFLVGTPLPLLIGAPIIAWSRVRLRRHTLAQTVAGTLLGLAVLLAAISLIHGG